MENKNLNWNRLRIKREERGLTVQQVFEQTRVPVKYILAFEEGNFEGIGLGTNIYPFLSTYCKFIGEDPNVYYDLYLEWARENLKKSSSEVFKDKVGSVESEGNFKLPIWVDHLFTWGIISVILLLLWVIYSFVTYPLRNDLSNKVDAGTRESSVVHFEEEY
ncbi:MAG: helix-turn-helix domain-containing protein [Candidatus Hydrogenedentes bacterium]|nr:helix-turn-helix domain-containing protein [Candidatus Hydrogenedentota bacterium]